MQINKEPVEIHSIRSYSEHEVTINSQVYHSNLIVCRDSIITDWQAASLQTLDLDLMKPVLETSPEVIIIGHTQSGVLVPLEILMALSQQRIGLEAMSLGAACRTFNILLSEGRNVTLGIIFSP
ncbi:Mth938-like domain-containing protein [Legionella yabuuchiae]|uniref:Mth938-like domain-containing protein n=1 Tax=Legionella yabuuchiae TaxID=376727 RepID=UPI001055D320|nr:MTH938/NDUFAF3 family protein [Legionella yabuuchiae]